VWDRHLGLGVVSSQQRIPSQDNRSLKFEREFVDIVAETGGDDFYQLHDPNENFALDADGQSLKPAMQLIKMRRSRRACVVARDDSVSDVFAQLAPLAIRPVTVRERLVHSPPMAPRILAGRHRQRRTPCWSTTTRFKLLFGIPRVFPSALFTPLPSPSAADPRCIFGSLTSAPSWQCQRRVVASVNEPSPPRPAHRPRSYPLASAGRIFGCDRVVALPQDGHSSSIFGLAWQQF